MSNLQEDEERITPVATAAAETELETVRLTTTAEEETGGVVRDSSTKKLLSNMTASRRLERFLSATDRAPAMNLEFVDIVAQVPAFPGSKQMKTILKNVRGVVNKGEFLALMGPSGAGKSTLLNVLGTRFDGEYSGQVLINGEKRTKRFKKHIGYVLQNDVLMPNLTVRESFEVTARLRLPESVTAEQRKERIDDIIHILGLSKCENTMVQMVSGGERKRVSVGNEMLINPSVLFLDEPTSGLDSTSAYNMLLTLKELCRQGRTVICAIHQPSSQMFAKFDRLLLLAWGNVIFHGNASDAVQYFSQVGYPCPMHFNPADFLLELITDTFQSESELFQNKGEIKTRLIQAWKEMGEDMMKEKTEENNKAGEKQNGHHDTAKTLRVSVSLYADETNNNNKDADQAKWATSWWTQFRVLLYRAYRHRRGNIVTPLRVFDVMSSSILAGIIYFRVKRTESKIVDFMGACFFIQVYVTFMTMFRSVMYFPTERQVIRKERQSGAYQLTSYYCGKILAEFPVDSVLPLMAVTVYYWFVGMGDNFGTYILYLLATCLTVWTANAFGTMAGCALMDFERAITALSVSGLFLMLLGGFYVKTSSIPIWISWVGYLSHFRWAVVTSENVIMRHVSFKCADTSSFTVCETGDKISGIEVLDWYGTETRPWFGPMMLLILSTSWHLIAYTCLRRNTAVKNALGGDKPLAIIEDEAPKPAKGNKNNDINKEKDQIKKAKDKNTNTPSVNTEEAHD